MQKNTSSASVSAGLPYFLLQWDLKTYKVYALDVSVAILSVSLLETMEGSKCSLGGQHEMRKSVTRGTHRRYLLPPSSLLPTLGYICCIVLVRCGAYGGEGGGGSIILLYYLSIVQLLRRILPTFYSLRISCTSEDILTTFLSSRPECWLIYKKTQQVFQDSLSYDTGICNRQKIL